MPFDALIVVGADLVVSSLSLPRRVPSDLLLFVLSFGGVFLNFLFSLLFLCVCLL